MTTTTTDSSHFLGKDSAEISCEPLAFARHNPALHAMLRCQSDGPVLLTKRQPAPLSSVSMQESKSSLGSLHDVASKLLSGAVDDDLMRRYSGTMQKEEEAEHVEEEEQVDAHQIAADLYKARDFHERRNRRMKALAQLR